MSAACAAEVLVAANDLDDRLLECLSDCQATLVRTFEEAQRALREHLFKLVVIDLNFDNVRMFDLLQHVRSLADFKGVPVLCVQGTEAGPGISTALDRLVRRLGGKAFVDLRVPAQVGATRLRRLCTELAMETSDRRSEHSCRAQVDRRLCILIIDHDVDAAQRLGELLEQSGHEVDFAYNGAAGLDAARRLRPDVVFLDPQPPQLDGCEIARRLRQEPDLRSVLIVALTAAAREEDRERVREAGFDHHIVKPPSRQSIQKLLEKFVPHPVR